MKYSIPVWAPSRVPVLVSLGQQDNIAKLLRELVVKDNLETDVKQAVEKSRL